MSFCSHCGGNLAFDGAKFCAHCGQPQSSTPGPIAVAAAARAPEKPRAQEETLFNGPQATVTTTRFIVPGQTYPIAGITSIANVKESPKWAAPVVLILLGIAFVFNHNAGLGAFLVLPGILWCALLKTKHCVTLHTAGGETRAFVSTDGELVDDIIIALNQAVIRRG